MNKIRSALEEICRVIHHLTIVVLILIALSLVVIKGIVLDKRDLKDE
jgi:hypothetical protein